MSAHDAGKIIDAARITDTDTVFEAGTGAGALLRGMCERAARVMSFESNERLHTEASERFSDVSNLELVHGDAFSSDADFDVFVSSLPYSQSRRAFEWMAQHTFDRGAVLVQKEFADKLAPNNAKDRRAISIVSHAAFDITHVAHVDRSSFAPRPHVDSVILSLRRRMTLDVPTIRAITSLFSYRRKTLHTALRHLGAHTEHDNNTRLENLEGDEIVRIAQTVAH